MFTRAGWDSTNKADFGAFEFHTALCVLRAIAAHTETFFANRDAIRIYREVIFVNRRVSAFAIEVNERLDPLLAAVLVVCHCIMGRIQKELVDVDVREILFHGKPVIQEAMRVMP